uniref:Reverse transcriptase RNase H-like domain-containing protein n=1 Tax=Nothobranchius furzeri TaxID=105023 RepID=A0A8C6LF33_NOTFU
CWSQRHQNAKSVVKFLGHKISAHGIKADSDKAVLKTPEPQNVEDVRRLMGMVNYVGKFSPHLPRRETLISEAVPCGLGGVLMQRQPDGNFKQALYTSRSLTTAESRYAQIEKRPPLFPSDSGFPVTASQFVRRERRTWTQTRAALQCTADRNHDTLIGTDGARRV